jgi:hypothetical protein
VAWKPDFISILSKNPTAGQQRNEDVVTQIHSSISKKFDELSPSSNPPLSDAIITSFSASSSSASESSFISSQSLQRTQMVSSHSSVPSTPVTDPPKESSSLSPEASRVSSTGVFRMLTQQISQLRDAIQVFFWSMVFLTCYLSL